MRIDSLSFIILLITFTFGLGANYIGYLKRHKTTKLPFLSVIIPTYNDAETLAESVKSVYANYKAKNLEMIIVNDCSTDNTLDILKELSEKYKFRVINNVKNVGKVASLNKAIPLAKGDLILFLDSDTLINHNALQNMLYLVSNDKVAASTARYKPINKGFLAKMQELEYGMFGFIQRTYSLKSALSLWGGCILMKKKALEEVGLFSPNMITEDIDLALKLNEKKWKVRESYYFVESYIPVKIRSLLKQKIRWSAGFGQVFVRHYGQYLKHPLILFYGLSYLLLGVFFSVVFFKNILLFSNLFMIINKMHQQGMILIGSGDILKNLLISFGIFRTIGIVFLYPLFSVPYVLLNVTKKKELYKLLYIFPFSIIYIPIFSLVSSIGIVKGFIAAIHLKAGDRGW